MFLSVMDVMTRLNTLANTNDDADMQQATRNNLFYVVASPGGISTTYYIGTMNDSLPYLMATREEAQADNMELIEDYQIDIANGEREDDDEWEGEVLKARLVNDDEIAFFELEDEVYEHPLAISTIKDVCGL